jgi:CheY-like chemotaxis protein
MATILVVDDEGEIVQVLAEILGEQGYRVVGAANGRQGRQLLEETKPDLVLLDFMMPVLDGPGMLREMTAHPVFRNIPVLLLSSLPEAAAAEEARGYAAFLRKPFRLPALLRTIARLIGDASAGEPTRERPR